MRVLTASSLYFALVFGAGFVLGVVRTLFVAPHVGTRSAELMEMPVMLLVTVAAARWTVVRLAVSSSILARLGTGCIALLSCLLPSSVWCSVFEAFQSGSISLPGTVCLELPIT